MSALFDHALHTPLIAGLVCLLTVFCIHFLVQYFWRGLVIRRELKSLAKRVAGTDAARDSVKSQLNDTFAGTRTNHYWLEFEETLHEQRVIDNGESRIADIRATVPAEVFINLENLVDPHLGSEYFKHLPGIFTGLGIIGTFYGLITGLTQFDPALEPEALKQGLDGLFSQVQMAFYFSAVAIGLAMGVTFIEKWLYASCSKWVGKLSQALDGLFRAGVGEEYLSSLVKASQDNATQTRQLKESLVDDLKTLLTNLTERQITATQQLSTDLTQRLDSNLREPLEKLVDTVRTASGQQHEAVGHVLENLMVSFMTQMRETMGSQVGDLSRLMQQSAESLVSVESAMRTLVNDVQRAGQDSTQAMHSALRDVLQSSALHQRDQNERLAKQIGAVLEQMRATSESLTAQQALTAAKTQESISGATEAMTTQVNALASVTEATQVRSAEAVALLSQTTSEAVNGMNAGARAVSEAVAGLHDVVQQIASVGSSFGEMQGESVKAARAVAEAGQHARSTAHVLAESVQALGRASAAFKEVAAVAATEADARSRLLTDLGELTNQSRQAGEEFRNLTEEARTALTDSFERFGTGVSTALTEHLAIYQKQLSDSVNTLKSAIDELAAIVPEPQAA